MVKNKTKPLDELLPQVLEMFAAHMGQDCEIVMHDLTKGVGNSIVKIFNGHVTGRQVGGPATTVGLKVLSDGEMPKTKYNYINELENGRILRSSTIHFEDKNGKVNGAICVNQDITDMVSAYGAIAKASGFTFQQQNNEENGNKEVFVANIADLVSHFINEWQKINQKPVAHLSREEKIQAIRFFDKHGVFLISKAGERISKFLSISKFTLYQYLDAARKEGMADSERLAG